MFIRLWASGKSLGARNRWSDSGGANVASRRQADILPAVLAAAFAHASMQVNLTDLDFDQS